MTALHLNHPSSSLPPTIDIYLSHYQAAPLLRQQAEGAGQVRTSTDLNLTMVPANLTPDGVRVEDGRVIPWEFVQTAADNDSACYRVDGTWMDKVQTYSRMSGRVYSLYPTPGPPTMLVSGIPMHRIKGTNPYQDTLTKIRAISPITGDVLDTCTGLGYTACQASRSARRVVSIELDPSAHEIARQNPWSKELFDSPKIECLLGDSNEIVTAFPSESFDAIVHDPPQFSLAGELYSAEFYRQLHRVLRPRGRLFHYIGDPASRSGASTTRSVIKRLQEGGFRVTPHPEAFGVVAVR